MRDTSDLFPLYVYVFARQPFLCSGVNTETTLNKSRYD